VPGEALETTEEAHSVSFLLWKPLEKNAKRDPSRTRNDDTHSFYSFVLSFFSFFRSFVLLFFCSFLLFFCSFVLLFFCSFVLFCRVWRYKTKQNKPTQPQNKKWATSWRFEPRGARETQSGSRAGEETLPLISVAGLSTSRWEKGVRYAVSDDVVVKVVAIDGDYTEDDMFTADNPFREVAIYQRSNRLVAKGLTDHVATMHEK
jgi:hypothetical protein